MSTESKSESNTQISFLTPSGGLCPSLEEAEAKGIPFLSPWGWKLKFENGDYAYTGIKWTNFQENNQQN